MAHIGSYMHISGKRPYYDKHKPVLLLHCDGTDESQTFKDSGGTGHTVTAEGTAQIDTAQSKFGGASALFDGDSDYLTIPDHANWDISTNWTLELWAKLGASPTEPSYFISQYEDGDNRWRFFFNPNSNKFYFSLGSTAAPTLTIESDVCDIEDSAWHHCCLVKVVSEYGIYVDGNQIGYVSDATMDTYAGLIYIGDRGDGNYYYKGWMDEIRICQFNTFNAAPVVGLTNTIQVPDKPYTSWR